MWRTFVDSLFIAPDKAVPMVAVPMARAVPGKGLEGDRYFSGTGTYSHKPGPDRQVTLIEFEALEALERDEGMAVTPLQSRRNIVTRGVALNHLVGRRFWVGEVLLEGVRLNAPCAYFADMMGEKRLVQAMMHRSGLNCRVVEEGLIRAGDTIRADDVA